MGRRGRCICGKATPVIRSPADTHSLESTARRCSCADYSQVSGNSADKRFNGSSQRNCAIASRRAVSKCGLSTRPHASRRQSSRVNSRVASCTLKPPGTSAELYLEIYLDRQTTENAVALSRYGTRVLANLAELERFHRPPWTSGWLQGIIDAPWVNLTPGTRLGVIHDDALGRLATELAPVEARLKR